MLSLGWLAPLAEVEAVAGVDVVAETIVKAASAVSVGSLAMRSFRKEEKKRWRGRRTTRHVSNLMASSFGKCCKCDAGAMRCKIEAVDVQGKAIERLLGWKMGVCKACQSWLGSTTIIQSSLTVISKATTRGRKEGEERKGRTSRR